MNWKLILRLSLFGLAMGLATVFFLPSNVEPIFWGLIFVITAYAIASRCFRLLFAHGLATGIANSLWITAAHVVLYRFYLPRHTLEIAMIQQLTAIVPPRTVMVLTAPIWGLIFGSVIGLLALLLSTWIKPEAPEHFS